MMRSRATEGGIYDISARVDCEAVLHISSSKMKFMRNGCIGGSSKNIQEVEKFIYLSNVVVNDVMCR